MRQLGAVNVGDFFVDWGTHEAVGCRVYDGSLPDGYLDQFIGPRRRFEATAVILQTHWPVIAAILAASPTAWAQVEVSRFDLPSIFVMGGKPLTDYSRDKLVEWSQRA